MKRLLCLIALLSFLCSGCGLLGDRMREPVTFYYLQADFQHGTDSPVFASEQREASGHRQDLAYLMALYLMGPTQEDLRSPLPPGSRIYSVLEEKGAVTLALSDTEETLTDIDFTLACTCLALTCRELTQAETIIITSGSRSVAMTAENLLMVDRPPATQEETK